MTSLNDYDEATQKHIIEIGVFLYEKTVSHTKKYKKEEVAKLESSSDYEYQYIQLKKQHENLSSRLFEIREEEYKKGEIKVSEYKDALSQERSRCDKILSTIQADTARQIALKTEHLLKQISDLETKNKWYYSLYEDKSKGKNYEEELFPKLLDYNDKQLNSVWQITHVGSVLSEKTDFHFKHKDVGVTILLDTKNNLPTNPVVSTAEFERDVTRKETNAIGGIMLANGGISCKKRFEINKIQDKYLVYVSEFERNNIGYIFSLLDLIMEMSRVVDATCNNEVLRRILIDDYKRELANIESLERLKKNAQKNLEMVIADFASYFKEDIEMEMKTVEIQSSSVRVKSKTSTDVIDFDEMEEGKTVIGVRSKYYLEYGTTIQYFKNNYARNQKQKSLEHKENNVIIMVETGKK
jgi:hypothetical protein